MTVMNDDLTTIMIAMIMTMVCVVYNFSTCITLTAAYMML